MRLQLHVPDQATAIRQLFEKAGWRVDSAEAHSLCVSHPKVATQPHAQRHLLEMGLLTSNCLHIEFRPSVASLTKARPD